MLVPGPSGVGRAYVRESGAEHVSCEAPMAPTSQLRVYTIDEGRLDDFVRGWLVGVRPLRLKHGFTIEGAWVIPEQSRFIWILTYDGPGSFEERDAARPHQGPLHRSHRLRCEKLGRVREEAGSQGHQARRAGPQRSRVPVRSR